MSKQAPGDDGKAFKIAVEGAGSAGKVYIDGVDLAELDLTTPQKWASSNKNRRSSPEARRQHRRMPEASPRASVIAAAKTANAHEFISMMPEGYETDVGIGGGRVSGGQKQRISITNTINDPRILLLDGATSALTTSPSASSKPPSTVYSPMAANAAPS